MQSSRSQRLSLLLRYLQRNNVTHRLNKFLATAGVASRRTADTFIAAGRVEVNGVVANLGTQVTETDRVTCDGHVVTLPTEEKVYLVMHKPKDVVTSSEPTPDAPDIVLDLLQRQRDVSPLSERNKKLPRVFPVGRLDRDTTGLLILTNDGDLAYRLTHPKFACEKEYELRVLAPLTTERVHKLETGLKLGDRLTAPARVTVDERDPRVARIVVQEGRYHQIRRMCIKVGCFVVALMRLRINRFVLPATLLPGQWRRMTPEEVTLLSHV